MNTCEGAAKWAARVVALVLGLLASWPSFAQEQPITWAPLGYTDDGDFFNYGNGAIPSLENFSLTRAGVCAKARHGAMPNYCPWVSGQDSDSGYCSAKPQCTWEDDFATGVGAVCWHFVRGYQNYPGEAISRIRVLDHDLPTERCACPTGTIPDLDTGFCVKRRDLGLIASRTKYDFRNPTSPVVLDVTVRRGQGYPVANQVVKLTVTSSKGTPGTVLAAEGSTAADGSFRALYRFPTFSSGQIDTVTATCDTCEGPASVNIKMAPIVFGFFNGVWNTEEQAGDGLRALKNLTGPDYRGIPIRYEKFYNQSGRSTGNTEAQDIAETFMQRSNELDRVLANRWEHYWELLMGRHTDPDSLTGGLLSGLGSGGRALADLIDSAFSSMLAGFVKGLSQLFSNPPTAVDVAAHQARLEALAADGSHFVLAAHSQGNLFVNIAHDGLRGSNPDALVKVAHIAPASPTLRGEHKLADIDLVINGLRNFGWDTVAPINLWIPTSRADVTGHTLVGTYLDVTRAARGEVKKMIDAGFAQLAGP